MTQTYKDIAVFFNAGEEGLQILELAASLAAAQNALLIGICIAAPERTHPEDGFVCGSAFEEMIQKHETDITLRLVHAGKALALVARQHGIDAEFRIISYTQERQELSMQSLYCDLLVIAQPRPDAPLLWSTEALLRNTATPILIIPQAWSATTPGQHIVLGWNGSQQARRSITAAMPLLITAARVTLLLIDPEQNAPQPGVEMATYLTRHGANVELVQVVSEGRAVARVIVEQAHTLGADLIVIGAYGHGPLREALFGGITRSMLKASDLPLLISN